MPAWQARPAGAVGPPSLIRAAATQAGVLVASSFPDHCDALALMNGTAQLAAKAA